MRKIDLKRISDDFDTYVGNIGEITLDDDLLPGGLIRLRVHDNQTPGGLPASGAPVEDVPGYLFNDGSGNLTWSPASGTSYVSHTGYVIANVDGTISTSIDGITWTSGFDTGNDIHKVATNGITIAMIQSSQLSYTSFDSPSTSTYVSGSSSVNDSIDGSFINWRQIDFANGYFIAVGGAAFDGYSEGVWGYSTDGQTWTFRRVDSSLVNLISGNPKNNDWAFEDIDFGAGGWLFGISDDHSDYGGGVYITSINQVMNTSRYFTMVQGYEIAWNGSVWYFFNGPEGSGFSTTTDPLTADWLGPFDPAVGHEEELGYTTDMGMTADTACGGNGYLAVSTENGLVFYSADNGINWSVTIPLPYTATVTNITNGSPAIISYTGNEQFDAPEKITISGSSVGAYNGTLYVGNANQLYSDQTLTIPFDTTSIDPFTGTATLTWSHGEYIDAMDYANGYFYVGNDDEQILRTSDFNSWILVNDQHNTFAYWNDIAYSEEHAALVTNKLTAGSYNVELTTDGYLTLPGNIILGTWQDGDAVMWAGEDSEYASLWWGGVRDPNNDYGPAVAINAGGSAFDDPNIPGYAPVGNQVSVKVDDNYWFFRNDGALQFPDGSYQTTAFNTGNVRFENTTMSVGHNAPSAAWEATLNGSRPLQGRVSSLLSVQGVAVSVTSNNGSSLLLSISSSVTPLTGYWIISHGQSKVIQSVSDMGGGVYDLELNAYIDLSSGTNITLVDQVNSSPPEVIFVGQQPEHDNDRVEIGGEQNTGVTDFGGGTWNSYFVAADLANPGRYKLYNNPQHTSWPLFDVTETYIPNTAVISYNNQSAYVRAVKSHTDGTSVAFGHTYVDTDNNDNWVVNPFVVKYDQDGNVLWQKTIQIGYYSQNGSMSLDVDGNIFCAFTWYTSGFYQSGVFKLSGTDGSITWQSQLNAIEDGTNVFINAIEVDSVGNPAVIGYTNGAFAPIADEFFIVKLNGSTGTISWINVIGDASEINVYQSLNGLAIDPNDHSIVATGRGTTNGATANLTFVIKISQTGSLVWQKSFEAPDGSSGYYSEGLDAVIDNSSNIFVLSKISLDYSGGSRAGIIIMRLSDDGSTVVWARRAGPNRVTPYCEYLSGSIIIGDDGCLYVHSTTGRVAQGYSYSVSDSYVAKYDRIDGTRLWQRIVGDQFANDSIDAWNSSVYGGKFIDTYQSNILIGGTTVKTDWVGGAFGAPGYDNYAGFVLQMPNTGEEMNIGPVQIRESRLPGILGVGLNVADTLFGANTTTSITTTGLEFTVVAGKLFNVLTADEDDVQFDYVLGTNGKMSVPAIKLTNTGFAEDYFVGEEQFYAHHPNEIDNNWVVDDGIELTRDTDGPLYNAAQENSPGGNYGSSWTPMYTEWNWDGWNDLSDIMDRNYNNWGVFGGWKGIGVEAIMHDTLNDNYYTVKFHSWGSNTNQAMGGAFSVSWRKINQGVFFKKAGSSDGNVTPAVDQIDNGLSIARGSGGGIYNADLETSWNDWQSPAGTLWNADGWKDLSNVELRDYTPFYEVTQENVGERVVGREYVMWDTYNNKYYAIMFSFWGVGSNNGGYNYPGFAYTRRRLNVKKSSKGIEFADGTVQTTAFNQQVLGTIPQAYVNNDVIYRFLTLEDVGKHVLITNSNIDVYIPDRGDVDFPVGSTITIINRSGGEIAIYCNQDNNTVTLYGAGTSNSGSTWYLPDLGGSGIATLIKTMNGYDGDRYEEWVITGTGIHT